MNPETLKTVLDDHRKWWRGDGGKRANLSGADLSGANLSDANLSDANLSGANLRDANLSGAVELYGDETLSEVPHGATVLARVIRKPGPPERMVMGDAEHELETPASFTLDLQWGACAMPVYSMDAHPSLTGRQADPQPGRGDMWQQVLDRYQTQLQPAVLELFRQRRELGISKYGTVLQAHNGRSIFKDLVQETLDRIAYAEQAATERPELADVMLGIQEADIATLGGLIMIYGRTAPDGEALP